MNPTARVDSIQALGEFRAGLWKFADVVQSALSEADADLRRTTVWLERDRSAYWKKQLEQRAEAVHQAKLALDHKRLYKTPTGGRYSIVEEQKALARARRRLEEAEQKTAAVARWRRRLEKESFEYRAQVQPLARLVETEVPKAVARLDRLVASLEAYVAVSAAGGTAAEQSAESVARDGLPTESLETWRSLRRRTPTQFARDRVAAYDREVQWSSDLRIDRAALDALDKLSLLESPAPDSKIVVAADAADADRIYLERIATASQDDSGWFIGSAPATGGSRYPSGRSGNPSKPDPIASRRPPARSGTPRARWSDGPRVPKSSRHLANV